MSRLHHITKGCTLFVRVALALDIKQHDKSFYEEFCLPVEVVDVTKHAVIFVYGEKRYTASIHDSMISGKSDNPFLGNKLYERGTHNIHEMRELDVLDQSIAFKAHGYKLEYITLYRDYFDCDLRMFPDLDTAYKFLKDIDKTFTKFKGKLQG